MERSRTRRAAWQSRLVLLIVVAGCGGKLAPPEKAAQRDAGALLDSGGRPVVEHIDPSSGPNSGGTTVSVRGAGFATDGGTQITFAGFPASQTTCPSESECVVISPWAGSSPDPQVVDVQATVSGVLGAPGALTSTTSEQDLFTFTAGPNCEATQECVTLGFPQLMLSCPDAASFYVGPWTTQQELVGQGTTYATPTQPCGGIVAACYGEPTNGSCSTYSLHVESMQCGAENFCELCKRVAGGICTLGPSPLCCTSICQATIPIPCP